MSNPQEQMHQAVLTLIEANRGETIGQQVYNLTCFRLVLNRNAVTSSETLDVLQARINELILVDAHE